MKVSDLIAALENIPGHADLEFTLADFSDEGDIVLLPEGIEAKGEWTMPERGDLRPIDEAFPMTADIRFKWGGTYE